MHRENWDDLRYVLAVADCGSVSSAARQLGVNHATVLRRVADFEARHEVILFERTAQGYQVLADMRTVVDVARTVADAMQKIKTEIGGKMDAAGQTLRLTTTDTLGQLLLPNIVAQMENELGLGATEILCTNAHVDLARLNIDIAVRPALTLSDDLTGTVSARMRFGVYVAKGITRPEGWLGMTGPLNRSLAAKWLTDTVPDADIRGSSDSFMILAEMAANGRSRVVLPRLIGERHAGLKRVQGIDDAIEVPVWVATRSDVRQMSVVRQAMTYLAGRLSDCDLL